MSSTSNTYLDTPPIYSKIQGDKSTTVSLPWFKWFDTLHYLNSYRNNGIITAAQAIDLDSSYVSLTTTTGTYAVTLAPPTLPGKMMVIEMIARGGAFNVTLALTNVIGGTAATTCTWNGTTQTLILVSNASKWVVIKQQGVTLS